MSNSIPKVSFAGEESKASVIDLVKRGVADALMAKGLPGAFSIDLAKVGVEGMSGQIHCKPTLSKETGRVMYNTSGEVIIGNHVIKPMGNWLLPKAGFTVDGATLTAYKEATTERDNARAAKKAGE